MLRLPWRKTGILTPPLMSRKEYSSSANPTTTAKGVGEEKHELQKIQCSYTVSIAYNTGDMANKKQ